MPKGFTPIDDAAGGTPKGFTPIGETQAPQSVAQAQTALGNLPPQTSWAGDVARTFGREAQAAGSAIYNTPGSIYHAFADQPTQTEQIEKGYPAQVPTLGKPALAAGRMVVDPVVNAVKWYRDAFQGKIPDPVGQALSVAPEAIGQSAGQALLAKGTEAGLETAGNAPFAAYYQLKGGLLATTHDILNKATRFAQRQLSDARIRVSDRVGALQNDIAATDMAQSQGNPSIVVSDLLPKIDDLATKYKAANLGTLPKYAKAAQSIAERTADGMVGNLTFQELSDLRTEIHDLYAKSIEGTRDRAAINELRETITQRLSDRAAEIGHSATFKAYNDLWSRMNKYQEGAFGKLLNAESGKDFMNTLVSQPLRAELERTFDSLSRFGLPENFMKNMKQHTKALDYVNSADKASSMGFMGKIAAISRHPAAGTIGYLGGKEGGGFIGGIFGATGAAKLADAIQAAKYIREQGGIPSRVGEMVESAKVQPSGAAPPPRAAVDPSFVNDLASALKNQGLKQAQAVGAARRAAQQFPGDFDKAFNAAYDIARGNFGSRK